MAAGMVHSASRPEHMNATTHHSKVRVTISLSSSLFVAGEEVTGKMEMECRADTGVGIGLIMAELFAVQELNSRDHSATSTFMHVRRLFQGPGLPPSNAVIAHPAPGQQPLPEGHYPARRGITTFFFRFPVPLSSPSAVSFASGLARVRYEVRASASVAHRGEKRLVTDVVDADIVQCADMDGAVPEHVVVGENGKVYVQGRVLGGRLVSGQQACVELHVKNHSQKKTTGLSLTLTRALYLKDVASPPPIQLTDIIVSENFRGDEYTVQPGVEGVASLVFNVPSAARVVKGGLREGAADGTLTAPLFELRCILAIRIGMGIASKDVLFEIPVQLSHPATLPAQQDTPISQRAMSPHPYYLQSPGSGSEGSSPAQLHPSPRAYASRPLPVSPQPPHPYPSPPLSYAATPAPYFLPPIPYAQPHHWSPPPHNMPYFTSAPDAHHQYYFPTPPVPLVPFAHPARPSSAGAPPPDSNGLPGIGVAGLSGLPGVGTVTHPYPLFQSQYHDHVPPEEPVYQHPFPQSQPIPEEQHAIIAADAEEGKGARASRITQHLRTSTRARSASPTAHRFPGTAPAPSEAIQTMHNVPHRAPAALYATTPRNPAAPPVLSPRPVRSPRHSFSGTPDAGVEGTARNLERMVDSQPGAEERSVAEVLRDLEQDMEKDKTLPPPPVPSGKALRESVPGVRDVFALNPNSEEAVAHPKKSMLRPSPMARRITAEEKAIRGTESGARLLKPATSGLDALEQRLLHEVGTRKPEKLERPTILPVPSTSTASHPPTQLVQHDSEISDLALASHGSAGPDARPTSNSAQFIEPSSPHKSSQEKLPVGVDMTCPRPRTTSAARDKDKDTPRPREDKTRQQEAMKLRKEAKGRVADWLGGVAGPPNDDVVGDVISSPVSKSDGNPKRNNARTSGVNNSADTRPTLRPANTFSSPKEEGPNAERQQTLRSPILPTAPSISTHHIDDEKLLDRKQPSTNLATSPPRSPRLSSSPSPLMSKPPALPKPPALASPRLRPGSSKDKSQPADTSPNSEKAPPQVPGLLSAPAMPEKKYDVRSARGGKGGITTSVAALWASMANEDNRNKPIKPLPKPIAAAPLKRPTYLDVGKAKPSPTATEAKASDSLDPLVSSNVIAPPSEQTPQRRNMVKSASVPAAVISTHARPHLSSSASLARPTAVGVPKPKPPSLSPTLSATREEPVSKATPVAQRELAFGQARLKDLIKKYQQAAS